jgi:uncharacterized protein (DUF1778 family)
MYVHLSVRRCHMATATSRLEIRVQPDTKSRIERAARLSDVSVSEFVRAALEDAADVVLAEHESSTRVDPAFYDGLIDALDLPARPAPAVTRAARRAATSVTQR